MIVHVTDLDLIEKMWPTLAPIFSKVTARTNGCFEPEDVLAELRSREQELWVACDDANPLDIRAVMTTTICQYPRRKVIRVIYMAGGDLRQWLSAFQEAVETYGRREGATLLEGIGREGWGKIWQGLRVCGSAFCKDLTA